MRDQPDPDMRRSLSRAISWISIERSSVIY